MSVECIKQEFGEMPSGEKVWLFTMKNTRGMQACVTNYGAILTQLHVPDEGGRAENVVLGFADFAPYLAKGMALACT